VWFNALKKAVWAGGGGCRGRGGRSGGLVIGAGTESRVEAITQGKTVPFLKWDQKACTSGGQKKNVAGIGTGQKIHPAKKKVTYSDLSTKG